MENKSKKKASIKTKKPSTPSKEEILQAKISFQRDALLLLTAQRVFHAGSIQASCREFVENISKADGGGIRLVPMW